jgi:hypothetical protein
LLRRGVLSGAQNLVQLIQSPVTQHPNSAFTPAYDLSNLAYIEVGKDPKCDDLCLRPWDHTQEFKCVVNAAIANGDLRYAR